MTVHLLVLGDVGLPRLIDDLVAATCDVAPGLDRAACRDLIDLIVRARVRQTAACGRWGECWPAGVAVGGVRPAAWEDHDPEALPSMFAAAAAALVAPPPPPIVVARMADRFRALLAPRLCVNHACRHSPICGEVPTFPLDEE